MFNNGSKVIATISLQKRTTRPTQTCLILMTLVRINSCNFCKLTQTVYMRIVSNYEQSQLYIIMILDGFTSGYMRIYALAMNDIFNLPTGSLNIIPFMAWTVYSHTTLNAIQYYINTDTQKCSTIMYVQYWYSSIFSEYNALFYRMCIRHTILDLINETDQNFPTPSSHTQIVSSIRQKYIS